MLLAKSIDKENSSLPLNLKSEIKLSLKKKRS